MQQSINILKQYWGFDSFKPMQQQVIASVLDKNDTLALLPTGGGKSLCFQIPALSKDGICIVISPLIALMEDQVNALKTKHIKAIALTSKYNLEDVDLLLDNCIYGNYKFLYLSPERLQSELVQERIKQMNVNLIAIDEAHCISQWGNDFRPAYQQIKLLRDLHPDVNMIALTASATPEVVNDIIEKLELQDVNILKQSFKRDNLAYMVLEEEDKIYRIEQILKKNPGSSIIYTTNRKSTVDLHQNLNYRGFTSTYYHGGLDYKQKDNNLNAWMTNQKQVMVATNAFGMGIDKPDVRTVIHINLPNSIEGYFQEAGRAGRDQKKAYAIMLKNKGDEHLVKRQFLNVLPSVDFIKQVYKKLNSFFGVSYGEGEYSTHDFHFGNFCKTYDFNTLITYNALQSLDRLSVIALSNQFQKRTTVQFLVSHHVVLGIAEKDPGLNLVIKALLRTYGGIFDQETTINPTWIATKTELQEKDVISVLRKLHETKVIRLNHAASDSQLTFLVPREDDKVINRIAHIIKQQNDHKAKQIDHMIRYANNDSLCKSKQLLAYFGETKSEACGICSVCVSKHKKSDSGANEISRIVQLLSEKDLSSRQIAEMSKMNESVVTSSLRILLEHDKIEVTQSNKYKLKIDEA